MFVQSISFHLKVGDTSANSHGFIGQFGCRNGMWHETSRICSRDNSEGPPRFQWLNWSSDRVDLVWTFAKHDGPTWLMPSIKNSMVLLAQVFFSDLRVDNFQQPFLRFRSTYFQHPGLVAVVLHNYIKNLTCGKQVGDCHVPSIK